MRARASYVYEIDPGRQTNEQAATSSPGTQNQRHALRRNTGERRRVACAALRCGKAAASGQEVWPRRVTEASGSAIDCSVRYLATSLPCMSSHEHQEHVFAAAVAVDNDCYSYIRPCVYATETNVKLICYQHRVHILRRSNHDEP